MFDAKPRSWDAYLAGIGVSGALMASASVIFVILVGVVTFSAWPQAGALLGDRGADRDLTLRKTATPPPAQGTTPSTGVNLLRLLGPGGAATSHPRAPAIHGGRVEPSGHGLVPGRGNDGPRGGSNGQGGQQPQQAPQAPSAPEQTNVVSQAVSNVGNTVQSTTESLGDSLGGSSGTGLGGVVGGLGSNLNKSLQSLAGDH